MLSTTIHSMKQRKKNHSGNTTLETQNFTKPISQQISDFIKKNFLLSEKKSSKAYDHFNTQQISTKKISNLEKKIGYTFKNKNLLINALTHPSTSKNTGLQFERLEFLGDRILNLTIAKMVFFEYPQMSESEMTPRLAHMICRERLFDVSDKIELEKYAIFKSHTQTKKIFADMIEAIIGAIYVDDDNNHENVTNFIHRYWYEMIDDELSNPRSELQELLHKYKLPNPYYEITQKNDIFQSKIVIKIPNPEETTLTSIGEGKSRKIANTQSAKQSIESLKDFLKKNSNFESQ